MTSSLDNFVGGDLQSYLRQDKCPVDEHYEPTCRHTGLQSVETKRHTVKDWTSVATPPYLYTGWTGNWSTPSVRLLTSGGVVRDPPNGSLPLKIFQGVYESVHDLSPPSK